MKNSLSLLKVLALGLGFITAGSQVQAQWILDPGSFVSAPVGGPALAGSAVAVAGGYTVRGAGTNISGTSDQFQFFYQSIAGDFDVALRLDSLSLADAWAQGGLMARENLTGGSRYAASLATPATSGSFFQFRMTAGGDTTNRNSFPAAYPNMWLRLQRSGSTFTGYAGLDGSTWSQLGTVILPLAAGGPMLVGLAVGSHNSGQLATAQFRDLNNVSGTPPVVSLAGLRREPIGPSSRRSGLAISEIMYHPRAIPGVSTSLEFIEIYNSQAFDEKIGGYRISGSVDYTFAANVVMKPGQYLVVARDPGAVQSHYGISGVLGPWDGATTNNLPGGSGTVRLRNRQGGVLLEVNYQGRNPWPIAADGSGHSLVLARPSYGEGNPQAWSASDSLDGSPGRDDPYGSDPLNAVLINEFLAHTAVGLGTEDYVELYNHGNAPVDLSGVWLSDKAETNKYRIPDGTTLEARGYRSFNQTTLGFALSAGGGRVYLVNSNQTRVIDVVDYAAQANGISFGRYPDGASAWYEMAARTPGAANGAYLKRSIVINELMYAPVGGDNDNEYIELYNRTTNAVDVSGWRFTSGINFTMPTNTVVPSNGFLVVAKNLTNLVAHYPNLNSGNTVGDYGGTLANGGERVALAVPEAWITTDTNNVVVTNTIYPVVNEVTYSDGGRWGVWADGGGSSLELVDPNSDGRQPANWADSDETGKSQWTSFEFTGPTGETLSFGGDRLQMFLLGVGECLVDEVEVHVNGSANIVANPGFEQGTNGWLLQGSHDFSTVEDGGFAGAKSLHLRAGSRGDNGPNRIQNTALSPAATGNNVTLRAKARWLRGWPELLLRTRGGGAEVTGRMVVPDNLGTPGAPNSRRLANAGPPIYQVSHSPSLPQAQENVVVTCSATDPDGVASVTLKYRVDNGATTVTPGLFASLPMLDDGTGGDAIAGDGVYSATLTGRPANAAIGFYIEAADSRGAINLFPQDVFPRPGLTRCFPNDAIARECVIRWGDTMMPGSFATYHLWLTTANSNRWASRFPNLNNAQLDGTFVYNNYRVVYNALPLYAGSPWHRGSMTTGPAGSSRVDFVQNFPPDDRMLGNTDFVLNNPGNPGGTDSTDYSAQTEQTSYIIFNEIGLVYNHRRYVHHFVNGNQRSTISGRAGNFIFEDSQQPDGDMIAEWFPDDTGGNLYKIEDWFEFPDNGSDFASNNDADLMRRTINLGGTNVLTTAPYRFMFRARSVGPGESASDYLPLFSAVDAISPTAAFGTTSSSNNLPVPDPAAFDAIVDVDQWLRVFACQHTIGNWDSYGYERGKNDYTYKPENGRFQQMTWDIDFTMGVGGHGTTQTIWDSNDPRVYGIWNTPVFMRKFWRAFSDIVNGPLNNTFMDPILDMKYQALRANNVNVDIGFVATIKSFVAGRRTFLLGELAKVSPGFAVFGTNNFSVNNNLLVLRGGAPITVAEVAISVDGGPSTNWPVSWSGSGLPLPSGGGALQYSVTNYTLRLVLDPGVHSIRLQGIDRLGRLIPSADRVLTVEYTGPAVDPIGALVFNEIMYNPQVPGASYVELYNNSDNSFDLTGYRVNGLDFTFPLGSVITNRQYIVLAKNRAAFSAAYTNAAAAPFAQFDGNLDPGGETLTLLRPGAAGSETVIDQVRYEARAPWGDAANGFGAALQLTDANQDNSRSSNWTDREDWRYFTYTGNVTFNIDTNFLMWLSAVGDAYIDDVVLVTGAVAQAGQNLLVNSGFEAPFSDSPLTGWVTLGNHSNTVITTEFSHSGSSSLHIISAGAGGPPHSVRQDVPAFTNTTQCTLSFWFRPTTNAAFFSARYRNGSSFNLGTPGISLRPLLTTPGSRNTTAAPLPPYDPLWLNELQPENVTGQADNFGQREPWIELYNAGLAPLDLSGYFLANSYIGDLTQWQFPAGSTIGAKEFKIIWADGQPAQTAGANLHTSFRLNSTTGAVALVRMVDNKPQITDYLTYANVGPDQSYGDYPDGQPFHRQVLVDVTPGGTNVARFIDVFINEWMAANTNRVADPADGQYDDWFELYNAGATAVDLGGFYLTDNPGNSGSYFQIPTNGQYVIPPQGFLLVWADTAAQNAASRPDLHVPFQLSRSGDSIALLGPDQETVIDRVDFGEQTDDVSQGRFPDGNANIQTMGAPTPRGPNVGSGGNNPPQLAAIQSRTIRLGQSVSFTASATDSDVPTQTLTFDLVPSFPAGAQINGSSGLFTWTPAPNQAPSTNNISVRVTDNGVPPLSATRTLTVIVLLPPHVGISHPTAGQVSLVFDTTPGRTYKVQFKNSLSDLQWQDLKAPEVAGGSTLSATDSLTANPQRFYRIIQLD